MDTERKKYEKQAQILNETQEVLNAAQTEVQELGIKENTLTREKVGKIITH